VPVRDGETKGSARVGYPRDELERGAEPGGRRANVERRRGQPLLPFVLDIASDRGETGVDVAEDVVEEGKTPGRESGWGREVGEPDSRCESLVSVRDSHQVPELASGLFRLP
jgi:hypothetical protein